MRLTTLTSFLCLTISEVWAHFTADVALERTSTTPSSAIDTIIPNRSYLIKLDCISCPFIIRHSNHNEWEEEPRPSRLTLSLYIDGPRPNLYLQGESLNPFWYERRSPTFYGQPHPFAPPFTANHICANETLQLEENNNGYGIPLRQFELAYKYEMVTYAPADKVSEWEVLIEFEITGLRHEEHVPKDVPFVGSGVDKERQGTVPGVTSIVRLILGYTSSEEMEIQALELMPKEMMAKVASKEVDALRQAAELRGEQSITTANWGGRLRDVNSPDRKDMYTDHVSFEPGEWNDCGRKDEWGRQIMCKVDDFKAWSSTIFVISMILVAISVAGMLILVVFASWLAIRILRGRKPEDSVAATGEQDALLLFGDEEIEEAEEKATKEFIATQNLHQAVI